MEHEPMPTTTNDDDLHCNTNSTSIGSSVIPVINKLQDIIAPFGRELSSIPLPQIAVVGSQSSGKSSVLEALVGRDFLPRGCDICTRRPLVLMLENRPRKEKAEDDVEWGEFLHLPGLKFYDFERIRSEIQTETEREAGLNKRVSNKPIRLTISSPNVLNMTLIDLPGITKVPVGDQPSDIEATVRKIIMSYIKHENCIILAVTPANSDLATSDALQMAIDVDPTGSRTIGVITKLDIMDRGTNALNFLLGKVVPLSLGYVGVVNRSQEDINNNRSIAEALAYEERFFHDYPVYHGLSDRCGIPQLAKKLNQILEQHIRTALPALKADLNSRLIAIVKELRTYGEVITSKAEQRAVLLTILTKYCEAFSDLVDGKSQISTKELSGGARIHYIFQSIFVKSLEEVDPCEDLTDEDIRMATRNATGPRNALFGPEVLFEYLVRRQIGRLLEPSLQCVRFVNDELKEISRASEVIEMQRFPALRRRVGEVMGKFLRDGVKPAETMIENIIEMEKDFINSSHPSFIGGSKAVELAKQEVTMSLFKGMSIVPWRVLFRMIQDGTDCEREPMAEKSQNSRAVPLAKSAVDDTSLNQGNRPQSNNDKPVPAGNSYMRTWGKSIFGSKLSSFGGSSDSSFGGTAHNMEEIPSTIQLTEPLSSLRPLEMKEHERVEIIITKLLLRSYFDIVRKNIQDLVPKAIMHFLVNHTKRDLLNTFIQDIYSENNVEEMLQEQNEIVTKRKRTREMFHVLQQAVQTLEEVESDFSSQGSSSSTGSTTKFPEIPSLLSQHDRTTKRETRTLEISSSANSRAHSID